MRKPLSFTMLLSVRIILYQYKKNDRLICTKYISKIEYVSKFTLCILDQVTSDFKTASVGKNSFLIFFQIFFNQTYVLNTYTIVNVFIGEQDQRAQWKAFTTFWLALFKLSNKNCPKSKCGLSNSSQIGSVESPDWNAIVYLLDLSFTFAIHIKVQPEYIIHIIGSQFQYTMFGVPKGISFQLQAFRKMQEYKILIQKTMLVYHICMVQEFSKHFLCKFVKWLFYLLNS
jgi:hypothetical protein